MKKIFLFLFLVLLCQVVGAQDTTRLSLLFLGDIMQHDSQIADAYDKNSGTYDYHPCFQSIKPYTQAVDLAFGNLEVTLAGPPYKGYPQFSSPDELLTALKNIGMDIIVTANNHSVDRGKAGLERTIDMLDSLEILHTGTFRNAADRKKNHPLLIEKSGFKLALLNYTYGTNGLSVTAPSIVNMLDTASIRKDITRAKTFSPDAIIVFTHWGAEYQSLPSKNQKAVAEFCFRHGAQLVIGSHPHVIQPMEWRKQKNQLVVYSLGNFVSGQRKRYTDGGALVRIELQKVLFDDGSALTAIDTAGYILEWVYRTNDAEKNYYVLPVPSVENQIARFIPDQVSQEAFKTFVSDSRSLFREHNVNIGELNSAPTFRVEFSAIDTLGVRKYLEDHSGVYQINDRNFPRLNIGPFTAPDARHLYFRIKYDLPVEGLEIRED